MTEPTREQLRRGLDALRAKIEPQLDAIEAEERAGDVAPKATVTIPSPPDLAALIDAYRAAQAGQDTKAIIEAHYALIVWKGWRKRTRFVHGDVAASMVWGSLRVVPWPADRPEPVQLSERSMTRDQVS